MNDMRTSSALRSLIEAAKSDRPGAGTRAEVWSSVCRSLTASVPPGSSGSTVGGVTGAKAVSLATLFGGAVMVGLASAVLILQPMRTFEQQPPSGKMGLPAASPAAAMAPPSGAARPNLEGTRGERTTPTPRTTPSRASPHDSAAYPTLSIDPSGNVGSSTGGLPTAASPAEGASTGGRIYEAHQGGLALPATLPSPSRPSIRAPLAASSTRVSYDPLAREASLLTQARAALAQGDPPAALQAVREAMAIPGRQLVPEEMSVESQALRAIGRSRDADAVTTELRTRYPDSALAR
jgi:hypothetical protein